jgi:uncharacterized protein (TIGR03086 family)
VLPSDLRRVVSTAIAPVDLRGHDAGDRRVGETNMAPSEQLDFQKQAIHDLIANTKPDQMGNQTPCKKWKVKDLMNHMVGGGHMFGAALKGDPVDFDPEAPMPDLLGDDPASAWDGAVAAFNAGIDTPGVLERDVVLPFGTMPGAVVLEIVKVDLLVHAWDLAQATDQQFDPPDAIVDPAMAASKMIIAEPMRDGDTFAAEVTPPKGASKIDQLAAFTGRAA